MDITPQDDTTTTQSISDDQELAKALAGIADDTDTVAPTSPVAPAPEVVRTIETPEAQDPSAVVMPPLTETPEPVAPVVPISSAVPAANDDLSGIKQTALGELRPLIDRLDLPVEDKFDTYLMLIRSTDDVSLIGPAHAAATAITDEKRKAQALLDIIKEIDFLSGPPAPQA